MEFERRGSSSSWLFLKHEQDAKLRVVRERRRARTHNTHTYIYIYNTVDPVLGRLEVVGSPVLGAHDGGDPGRLRVQQHPLALALLPRRLNTRFAAVREKSKEEEENGHGGGGTEEEDASSSLD
jgi:hypothetical protein